MPSWDQVMEYPRHVVDRFGMRQHIEFSTRIKSAVYAKPTQRWTLNDRTRQKAYTCTYFVSAAGVLSVTYEPPFKGLDSFKGEWCVSSRWPKETVEFTGKRVAIVGTGATGCFISAALALISRRFNSRSTTISRVSCCLKAEFEGRKGLACKGATHAPPARRW